MSAQISRDEWLAAIGDTHQPSDQTAITVVELAKMLGVGRMSAYRHILRLVEEGKATPAVKLVTFASGVTKRVTAYKLVKHAPRPATRRR